MTDAQGTFLALGPVPNTTLEEYQASIGSPPEHPVLHTHRFELSNSPNIVQTSKLSPDRATPHKCLGFGHLRAYPYV